MWLTKLLTVQNNLMLRNNCSKHKRNLQIVEPFTGAFLRNPGGPLISTLQTLSPESLNIYGLWAFCAGGLQGF